MDEAIGAAAGSANFASFIENLKKINKVTVSSTRAEAAAILMRLLELEK